MARIRKANVILEIKDTEVDRYIDLGYNLIDEDGKILKQSVPSTVNELQRAYKEHIEKIAELEAQIAELQKPAKKSKKVEATEE